MLAKHKEQGLFTDPSAHKPKSMFRMFLAWYSDSSFPDSFPCLTKLVSILATLPVGSASVERSFSKMKLIKTRLRNRLSGDSLEDLMLISMEGWDVLTNEQRDAVLRNMNSVPRAIALGPVDRATCS
eukprot:gene13458-biopygen6549